MKKKAILFTFIILIVMSLFAVNISAASPFSDVSENFWGYGDVIWVNEKGLMVGTTDTLFSPNTNMSRSMLTAVLWRYEGEPKAKPCNFADVRRGFWYTDSIDWAAENGIVYGMTDTDFVPNGNITREQLVTILYRYAASVDIDTSERNDLSGFADSAKVSSWAREAMEWAVAEGLIQGITKDGAVNVSPSGNATRAQVAAILHRFDSLMLCNSPATHDIVIDEGISPTCTENGLTEGAHCERCGLVITEQKVIEALGHDIILFEQSEASCTETGFITYICRRSSCDFGYTEAIEPIGHDYMILDHSEPTCNTEGYTTYVCQNEGCESGYTEWSDTVGHDYMILDHSEPTCEIDGYTTYVCQNEGCESGYTEWTEALGHDYMILDHAESSCESEGYTTYVCQGVGCESGYTEWTDALGHSWSDEIIYEWSTDGKYCTAKRVCNNDNTHTDTVNAAVNSHVIKEASCTVYGTTVYTATFDISWAEDQSICLDDILPKGHTEVTLAAVSPTCTQDGLSMGTVCSVCREILVVQNVLTAPGHDIVILSAKEPTCLQAGLTEGKYCRRCEEVFSVQTVINASGHDFKDIYIQSPTCTQEGYTDYMCLKCGNEKRGDYVPTIAHTEAIDEAVAPTCTKTGLSEGKHCSVCNKVLDAQKTVDRLGHKTLAPVRENEIPSECEKNGSYDTVVYCERCGDRVSKKTTVIPMTGHNYAETERRDPTCTEGGIIRYTCQNDAEHTKTEMIGKAGHDYKAVITPPTCTAQGYTTYSCQREGCNHYYKTNYIDALGHNYDAEVTVPGSVTYTCSVCGHSYVDTDKKGKRV